LVSLSKISSKIATSQVVNWLTLATYIALFSSRSQFVFLHTCLFPSKQVASIMKKI